MNKNVMYTAISLALVASSLAIILVVYREIYQSNKDAVELTKADCIETCIRVLQTEQLFPDYHRTVKKCNDLFAEVETCRLAK